VASGGTGAPNVNLGPPDISETTRARKLNLKIPLDVVKYPLWVQKLLYYDTTWGRPPYWLSTNVCLRGRLQLTTARRLSAYMQSRALATTTGSSFFNIILRSCLNSRLRKRDIYIVWHNGASRPFWVIQDHRSCSAKSTPVYEYLLVADSNRFRDIYL